MTQEELEKEWCRRNGFDDSFAVLAPVVAEKWTNKKKPKRKPSKFLRRYYAWRWGGKNTFGAWLKELKSRHL